MILQLIEFRARLTGEIFIMVDLRDKVIPMVLEYLDIFVDEFSRLPLRERYNFFSDLILCMILISKELY